MRHNQIARELRRQARQLNLAADILDGKPSTPITTHTPRVTQPIQDGRPNLSKAARRKISIAQKKRWALVRGGMKRAA